MAQEEKPLEYKRRILDTKGIAQRLDLAYLNRATSLLLTRKRATYALLALAAAFSIPMVLGVGASRKNLQNAPVSEAHAFFEQRCEFCHTQSFKTVSDQSCKQCHHGAAHPAKDVDSGHATAQIACTGCHMEHRGRIRLSFVGSGKCTDCHADIAGHS